MNIIVLTPDEEVYAGPIQSVKVPGTSGQFEILNGHAPIVSSLITGEVRILDGQNKSTSFNISSGFVEVLNNEVNLLVQLQATEEA